MFVLAQLDPNLASIIGMLIAAIILRLGLSAARNPESKLHKVFTLVLAIIRYPLWIFTALVGGGLVLVGINIPGLGGFCILLGLFLIFAGVMGLVHAFKSHKGEEE